jgi:hypothetical protein
MTMFPYDVNELADGPIRCMFAPIGTGLPADLGDIIDQVDPYDPVGTAPTDWREFGATAGPFTVSRAIASASYNIQQTTTAVRERVTEVTRTVTVAVAELRPDIVAMLEEGAATDTAAAAGLGAYAKITFGNIEDLTQYRMAFIGRRGKDQGIVQEAAGAGAIQRGRLFAYVAYRCALAADNLQIGFAEGDLANANVNFKLYPEPGRPQGQEHGIWLFEDAGTLT